MTHLTVVSYNIHRGVGLDRRHDLDRIADVIAEVSPDVVGLQEVIREDGMPHADQAAYLAARLGMSEIVMGETRTHTCWGRSSATPIAWPGRACSWETSTSGIAVR